MNKIKRGKQYTTSLFADEFLQLISDSPEEELQEIFISNRHKRERINKQHIEKEQQLQQRKDSHEKREYDKGQVSEKLVTFKGEAVEDDSVPATS